MEVIHTLVARVEPKRRKGGGRDPGGISLLGEFSAKAGDFRDIAQRLVRAVGRQLGRRSGERKLAVDRHVFHLRRNGDLVALCLCPAASDPKLVSKFLAVVHSQIGVLLDQNASQAAQRRRRRRHRREQTSTESAWLFDASSRCSAVLQHCMSWAAAGGADSTRLLLGTRTKSAGSLTSSSSSAHASPGPPSSSSSSSSLSSSPSTSSLMASSVATVASAFPSQTPSSPSTLSSLSPPRYPVAPRRPPRPARPGPVGLLLPVGFGDGSASGSGPAAGASLLEALNSSARQALQRDVAAATDRESYLNLLDRHRAILMRLPLPNAQPTTQEQAQKDAVREVFLLNGRRFTGEHIQPLLGELERMLTPFAYTAGARRSTALDVLRAASRTCTGGDSYFAVAQVFGRPGVMVTAGHMEACPIEIRVGAADGVCTIRSHNVYALLDEDGMMMGGGDEEEGVGEGEGEREDDDDGNGGPIVVLDTVVVDRIDCISGASSRSLCVTNPRIEATPLIYKVSGAGTPSANGTYTRLPGGWSAGSLRYANSSGYFLSFGATLAPAEKMRGKRVVLDEFVWTLGRSPDRVAYVCTAWDSGGGSRGGDGVTAAATWAPQAGWRVVAGEHGGVLPAPVVVVESRGYAKVLRSERQQHFDTPDPDGAGGGGGGGGGHALRPRQPPPSADSGIDLLSGSPARAPAGDPSVLPETLRIFEAEGVRETAAEVSSPGTQYVAAEEQTVVLGGNPANRHRRLSSRATATNPFALAEAAAAEAAAVGARGARGARPHRTRERVSSNQFIAAATRASFRRRRRSQTASSSSSSSSAEMRVGDGAGDVVIL